MKKYAFLTLFAVAAALTSGCFRPNMRTVSFNVPQMGSPECIKAVQDALSGVEGIVSAQPDMNARSIAVTYDSRKVAIKNIEYVLTGIGFDTNDSKASSDARAKLPAACR